MLSNMTSSHKLVLYILAMGMVVVAACYFVSPLLSLGLGALMLAMIWFLRGALMPPGFGANKVRMASLTLSVLLLGSYGYWSQLLNAAAQSDWAKTQLPWLAKIHFEDSPSIIALLFFGFIVWLVNHYMADRSIAGGHPTPLAKDFPDISFQQNLVAFCNALRDILVRIDKESNWSPNFYTELEAEVEIVSMLGQQGQRRVTDLQKAMRAHNDTQAFLILGDPGAGKSVALRKLARDMLDEAGSTGRIPIYVNLREWLPKAGRREGAWSEQNPPTMAQLEAFVIESIKSGGDVFTEEFVDLHFRALWKHGRLYFLFDSFDEIPELLDVNEESWLLDALSSLLSRFINTNPLSRGVLASRVFRRPTQAYLAQQVLEIRPLSEDRIAQALTRFQGFSKELRDQLFRIRSDLVPIARNPFLMTLLGEWVNTHRNLPQTQLQLYESYLSARLDKCKDRLAKTGLTQAMVLAGAGKIASFVFNSPEYGLEAPVQVIDAQVGVNHSGAIMDVLSYARIARVSTTEEKSFAFVHRRFLEYFVTTEFLAQPERLPEDHIPTDSRGRDAMVLYAQVCQDSEAERLAKQCWSEVQKYFHDPENRLRAVHSLRFLIEAFRARRSAVKPFVSKLATFITKNSAKDKHLVFAKICLEGTGLLDEEAATPILQQAMQSGNSWLQETAFRACRNLPRLSVALEQSIKRYILYMPIVQFWGNYRVMRFSLSLSDALKEVQSLVKMHKYNLIASGAAVFISFFVVTYSWLFAAIFWITFRFRHIKDKGFYENFPLRSQLRFYLIFSILLGYLFIALGLAQLAQFTVVNVAVELKMVILVSMVLALLDWQIIKLIIEKNHRLFGPYLKKRLMQIFFMDVSGALLTIVFYGLFLIIYWAIFVNAFDYVLKHNPSIPVFIKLILNYSIFVFLCLILFNLIQSAFEFARVIAHNRAEISKFTVNERVGRLELARIYSVLKTDKWRMRFITRIAQLKVVATGNWPTDFKLAGNDPAITELARLEERWLKLDR
jgi:hypothetical protein